MKKRALFAAGCVAIVSLAFAAPSQASTYGKAVNASKKFASQACQRDSACTRFAWQCGQPRRHGTQVPCKAYIDEDTASPPTQCLIGLTWGVSRNKIYLLKYGKPQCYPIT
jgi:hypothetical protein